jgi:UPF0716 protein FxsA
MPIFLLFIIVPLTEALILLKIMSHVGFLNTIVIVLITATVGFTMAKKEGLKVLKEIQEQSKAGVVPKETLLEGFLVLIAGLMLLFPGLLSDLLGFSFLIPPIRKNLISTIRTVLKTKGWKEDEDKVEYEIID